MYYCANTNKKKLRSSHSVTSLLHILGYVQRADEDPQAELQPHDHEDNLL